MEGADSRGTGEEGTGLWLRTVSSSPAKNRQTIQELLKNPPKSWQKLFREEGLSANPSIEEILSMLDETAGSNPSGEMETDSDNPKNLKPPAGVRKDAMKGVLLSYENNYPSWKGIGLARGVQLATQDQIWRRSADRMSAFFKRNQYYKDQTGFGDDANPSKSYLAWLNWAGDAGEKWVQSL